MTIGEARAGGGAGWAAELAGVRLSRGHRSPAAADGVLLSGHLQHLLPDARRGRPGLPAPTGQAALCRENPGAFGHVTERGHTLQNHPEEVDGVTQRYRAQRGQPLASMADRAPPPEPWVHSDSLAHPPRPRNSNHPAGEPDGACARGRRGRRGLQPPPPTPRRRVRPPLPSPRLPPRTGGARPLRVALRRGHLQGSLSSPPPAGSQGQRELRVARTTTLLQQGQRGTCQLERRVSQRQRQGDDTHRSCSCPSPPDRQTAGGFVIRSRKGDPDPAPHPRRHRGQERWPHCTARQRRAGLRPAA